MKTKTIFSLIGVTLLAFSPTVWPAAPGGGSGGFGGGFAAGGHVGGGGGRPSGGAFHSTARGFNGGGPAYFYSRGMDFARSRNGQMRSPIRQSHSPASTSTTTRRIANSGLHSAHPSQRAPLNGRTDHIAERHDATRWHTDWDRRHTHFFHRRFFVFDDGFWFGLDPGFFPWDYYPYYAYDYYPYDYYPGYYADVEPYYYNEGVYSDTPMQDPTVNTVQTELTRQGYYNGPIDGIYGPTTRDAVANYQIAKRLEVTGSLSPDTLHSLGLPPATSS